MTHTVTSRGRIVAARKAAMSRLRIRLPHVWTSRGRPKVRQTEWTSFSPSPQVLLGIFPAEYVDQPRQRGILTIRTLRAGPLLGLVFQPDPKRLVLTEIRESGQRHAYRFQTPGLGGGCGQMRHRTRQRLQSRYGILLFPKIVAHDKTIGDLSQRNTVAIGPYDRLKNVGHR